MRKNTSIQFRKHGGVPMCIPFIRALLLASIAILLPGCYESEKPILAKGERTPLHGKFQCRYTGDKDSFDITLTEHKEGSGPTASYRYLDDEGHGYLLKRLRSGLFVGQAEAERSLSRFGIATNGYEYAFLDIQDDDTFVVLFDEMERKWRRIEVLLAKVGIEHERADDLLLLKGPDKRVLEFFAAHDRTMLKESSRCQRLPR